MNKQELRDKIADYVIGNFNIDEIVSVEENCGSFWMNMFNGETWYIEVGLCEKEDSDL